MLQFVFYSPSGVKILAKTYSPENLLSSKISWLVSIYEYNIGLTFVKNNIPQKYDSFCDLLPSVQF